MSTLKKRTAVKQSAPSTVPNTPVNVRRRGGNRKPDGKAIAAELYGGVRAAKKVPVPAFEVYLAAYRDWRERARTMDRGELEAAHDALRAEMFGREHYRGAK